MLQQRGAKSISALIGGWNEWLRSGSPVEK
jgi:3-mercaptopyruvate sulfurtransferase SseA